MNFSVVTFGTLKITPLLRYLNSLLSAAKVTLEVTDRNLDIP